MTQLKFIFRADKANVGDWFSPPFRYFPFKKYKIFDIYDDSFVINESDIVIVGGGGIGTENLEDT